MISSSTGPPTFAASAYEVRTVYNILSIACEAANGHTCSSLLSSIIIHHSSSQVCPLAASQAILLYILYTVRRPKLRTWVAQLRTKSYCVVLKRHCIVCYCIASVPVFVFCDGRTHGQTHNPILSGIRCFLRRNATQRRNATTRTHK